MEKEIFTDEQKPIDDLINRAFQEDVGPGDVTTEAIIDVGESAKAVWKSKNKGIIAGLDIAGKVYRRLDPDLEWSPKVNDGYFVPAGTTLVSMKGRARALLTAERVALNIAQRMSGIATKTYRLVEALNGLNTKILDTRKTVPGLRVLDKYAVKAGGGTNHRMGLYDMAMIKDNHIIAAGSIARAVELVHNYSPSMGVEVETSTLQQVEEALSVGADIIMLDNMSLELMQQAVQKIDGLAKAEASGNITIENVREVAKTGVDYISVGALTHSVRAYDISQILKQLT